MNCTVEKLEILYGIILITMLVNDGPPQDFGGN